MITVNHPKWVVSDRDLVPGDVVYFCKSEWSAIKGPWSMGMVESTVVGRDQIKVKYFNAS